jgi:hypothetical protein
VAPRRFSVRYNRVFSCAADEQHHLGAGERGQVHVHHLVLARECIVLRFLERVWGAPGRA